MSRSALLLVTLALLFLRGAAQHRSTFLSIPDACQHRRTERLAPDVFETHKGGETQALHYASNYHLERADTAIHTLLINIHGLHRNAMGAYESAEYAAKSARQYKTTLIIAPAFTNDEDLND
jgi:hypothetical protein